MSVVKQAPVAPVVDDGKVRASYALDRRAATTVPMYWRHMAAFTGSGTLLAVGAMEVAHSPYVVAGGAGCALVAVAVTGATGRADVRREVNGALRSSVERVTGPLRWWRCRRWSGGVIGSPRVIKLRYRPDARVGVGDWPKPVTTAIAQMLHATYEVTKHQPARGILVLRRKDSTDEEIIKSRSERVLKQLFGEDCHVARKEQEHGEQFTVTYTNVVKAADPTWRANLEHVVDVALPGRWRARWDLLNDQVRFEVRPQLPKRLVRKPPATDPSSKEFWQIPLGEDEDGNVVCWNLKSSNPHVLIAGKTGRGKTNQLLGLAQELSSRRFAVWAVDPKRIELQAVADLPNVQVVATEPEEMAALIECAYAEMERRYKLIKARKARKGSFDRLIIIIDEFAEFAQRIQGWWTSIKIPGMTTKPQTLEHFDTLLRLARAAGIHLILGIQRPDTRFISGEARDNCDARLSLGPLTRDGSEMMWESQIGCTTGRAIGRAMARADDVEPKEIQTYWTPDPENDELDDEILALLKTFEVEEVHPKMRISIPDPDEDDKGRELWWDAVQEARLVIDDTPRVERIVEEIQQRPKLHLVDPVEDEYGAEITVGLDQIVDGDLYWRQDEKTWVQVMGAEPDPIEPSCWAVAWEDTDGTDGTDLLPDDTRVKIRHLL